MGRGEAVMGLAFERRVIRLAWRPALRAAALLLGACVLLPASATADDPVQAACRAAEPQAAGAMDEPAAAPATAAPAADTEVLRLGSLRVVRRGDHLLAFGSDGTQHDDAVALQQPDYGSVQAVHVDRTGGLVAIGDQLSYRVRVALVDGRARFTSVRRFPLLFGQRCFLLSQLWGTCQPARAVFSPALRAGLIEGFDRWGLARSYAIGLAPDDDAMALRAPRGGTPQYRFDVPATGGARFRTRNPAAQLYFDGQRMHECPP